MIKRLVYTVTLMAALMMGFNTLSVAKDDQTTVLELFTSQGCVGCVSADAALKQHRGKPGMIVLSWPVDYLDRFGWADTFAHPSNTLHQKAYNKRLGKGGMVYTPEMIINGRYECVGNDKPQIRKEIETAKAKEHLRIKPTLSKENGIYVVNLPETKIDAPIYVRAIWYLSDSTIEVTGGENEGKWLHLTNVVRHSEIIGEWDGRSKSFTIVTSDAELPKVDGLVILLHEDYYHGALVGAASTSFSAD